MLLSTKCNSPNKVEFVYMVCTNAPCCVSAMLHIWPCRHTARSRQTLIRSIICFETLIRIWVGSRNPYPPVCTHSRAGACTHCHATAMHGLLPSPAGWPAPHYSHKWRTDVHRCSGQGRAGQTSPLAGCSALDS